MANAAAIAGLGFGNALVGLAHALGHSFGGIFKVPHGRAVGLFLPYVIEFSARMGVGRYDEIARYLRLTDGADFNASSAALVAQIRSLQTEIGQPTAIAQLGIPAADLEEQMDLLCANAIVDNSTVSAPRPVEWEELQQLFLYAYEGKSVDF